MNDADERIRRFSAVSAVAALMLLAALVLLPGPRAAVSAAGAEVGWRTAAIGPLPAPWEDPAYARTSLPARSGNGYVWEGTGRAVLELPADLLAGAGAEKPLPFMVTATAEGSARVVRLTPLAAGIDFPETIVSAYRSVDDADPSVMVADGSERRLYVEATSDWTVRLQPAEEIVAAGGSARGSGSALVRYDGPATAARLVPADPGEYLFVVSHRLHDMQVHDVPQGGGRIAWDGGGTTWFMVMAAGGWRFEALGPQDS